MSDGPPKGRIGTLLLILFGGVLLASFLRIRPFLHGDRPPAPDFDLSGALVPAEEIVPAGMPKDGLEALVTPPLLTVDQLDSINADHRKNYVVSGDLVIGVAAGGAARAYPVGVLNWHEVANDTLGGVPIVVTWNPLSGGAAVYRRIVDGEVLVFGVSGLLYNSNLLLYDRRPDGAGESLWSQLLGAAVTGPAAAEGARLEPLPCALTSWKTWREISPGTDLIGRDPRKAKLYKKRPYSSYYNSEKLRFPARPLPEGGRLPLKARVIAVQVGGEDFVFSFEAIEERAGRRGAWETALGGEPVEFLWIENPPSAVVLSRATGLPMPAVYSFWFARYAMNPSTEPVDPDRGP